MTSATPSHEASFAALAKFLKFLVVPSQKFSLSSSNSNSFSSTWYECTIISSPRVVDPEMTKIGVDAHETSIFTSCFLSSSSSSLPSSIQMSTFCPKIRKMIQDSEKKTTEQIEENNNNHDATVFYAVAIQETKPVNIVVTIVLVDEFVKSAATHCDLLFKKELKNRTAMTIKKKEENDDNNSNNHEDGSSLLESLLLVRLFLAPNSYQCWNMKREILSSLLNSQNDNNSFFLDQQKQQLWANEMSFNSLMLARVPKSPESWFQRTWLMTKLFSLNQSNDLVSEESKHNVLSMLCRIVQQESVQFGLKACTVYKRNYPSWEYRRRLWMEVPLAWDQKKSTHLSRKQDAKTSLLSAVYQISSTSSANCLSLFEDFLLNSELRGTLAFFEKNPSDASAVSFLSNLLLKIIDEMLKEDEEETNNENNINRGRINELVNTFIDDAWQLSQKLIRNCCLVQKMSATADTPKALFSLPQLSHEAIWFLRRAVVEASLKKMGGSHAGAQQQSLSQLWKKQHQSANNNDNNSNESIDIVIHRGWSLSDEIQFVSTIVESHELALRIISENSQEKNNETVAMIPLNKKDFVSVDQGSFSVIHGLQYLQWLLSR